MMTAFRKYLLIFCLGAMMTNPTLAAQEHEKEQCRQVLLEKLKGGAARVAKGCAVTNKLAMWLALQKDEGGYSFEQIIGFIQNNPSWPNQVTMKRKAEAAITASTPSKVLVKWFDKNPPQTTDGALAYIAALKKLERTQDLMANVKRAWVERDFSKSKQKSFLGAYSSYLNNNDHQDRLERLLWNDQVDQAKRLLPLVDAGRKKMAEARMAFKVGKKSGIPSKYQNHEGVIFDQVRSLRKQGRYDEAAKLILGAKQSPKNAAHWWYETHYIAREFMEKKRFKEAKQLVAKHKLVSGESFATAEWTWGWLNLRFLESPTEAVVHFKKLFEGVKSSISLGRAAYWVGRSYEAMKNPKEAADWYKKAAQYRTTFYGQLGAAKLRITPHPKLTTHVADKTSKSQVLKQELVQVIHLLSHFGKQAYQWTRPFTLQLAIQAKSDHEKHILLDHLAKLVPHDTVWFARKAGAQKPLEVTQGYPHLQGLPKGREMPEGALSHAIAYQESRFDSQAVSSEGAMGLMQLMPETAKYVAKKAGVKHVQAKLIADPKHNVLLGAHNLAQLLDKFNGSYILAIAAYNAGEAPVERWLGLFGDPRKGEIDVIDWIELIPYYETRNYVQRVLENLAPYRLVLEGHVRETIIEDLLK